MLVLVCCVEEEVVLVYGALYEGVVHGEVLTAFEHNSELYGMSGL